MPNPVAYFEIGGRDAGQLREFYAALFGLAFPTLHTRSTRR